MSSYERDKMNARTQEFLDFVYGKGENICDAPKKSRAQKRFENFLSYGNLDFYKKKDGSLNIARIVRTSGISREVVRRELDKRGLL